ncbi:hypothetical protein P8452_00073 [Trifolium repens]|nr:hypothetical protein P8452_00073 [Trifolium repens]
MVPRESLALLSFEEGADTNNQLQYTQESINNFCDWKGVTCENGNVVQYEVESLNLQGVFPPNSLSQLVELRIINLSNNSLFGPIPDLSPLVNLKSLLLDHNHFSTSFPSSFLILERLASLTLSFNNLTGSLFSRVTSTQKPHISQTELKPFYWPFATFESNPLKKTTFSKNPNLNSDIIHSRCIKYRPPSCPRGDVALLD